MDASAYLTAKRTIDDRALNRRVLDGFAEKLTDQSGFEGCNRTVRVLEVGAGTGTMVARLATWDLLPERVVYHVVDRKRARLEIARKRIPKWLEAAGYRVETDQQNDSRLGSLHADNSETGLTVHLERADAFDVEGTFDAVVGCAFFDLVDLPAGVTHLFELLDDGGVLYAPITFDGLTRFVPGHPLDDAIERCYHRHMELRDEPGGPNAGRELVESIPETGGELLAVGGSDWLVHPVTGAYPHDERRVVEHLLATITSAVASVDSENGPLDDAGLDTDSLENWASVRHEQLAEGRLSFLAHNLDVLATTG